MRWVARIITWCGACKEELSRGWTWSWRRALESRRLFALWLAALLVLPGAARAADKRFTITEQQRRFWSFQPLKAPSIPAVRDTAWPRSSVDHFILAALEAKGLTPARPA